MLLAIQKHKMGSALYLTVVIMALLLAIALGLSAIIIGQLRLVRGLGYSVVAFYAADAGIEATLEGAAGGWSTGVDPVGTAVPIILTNGATYEVSVIDDTDPDCPPANFSSLTAANFCVTSVGTYEGVRRAIQVIY